MQEPDDSRDVPQWKAEQWTIFVSALTSAKEELGSAWSAIDDVQPVHPAAECAINAARSTIDAVYLTEAFRYHDGEPPKDEYTSEDDIHMEAARQVEANAEKRGRQA